MSDPMPIQVRLRFFAALREQLGQEDDTLILPVAATIADARAALVARHPTLAPVLAACVTARNRAFADDATMLADGDELVFIPPMAGGV